jgi:DAK2 domain fusion protein YloV
MISSGHKPVPQGFIVEDETVVACNGVGFRTLLQAGQKWLEVHVDFVNSLNVFPVPDGDTGTNMLLTMRSAIEQAGQASNHTVGTIADAAAQGALMGARGNSGVILSQFLQGLAQGVAGQTTFTAEDFAHAIQLGADQAYNSVVVPVEGTILTVAREAAEAAQKGIQDSHDLLLLLKKIVNAAKVAQANTPELLPVLKEAGVTDSGGQGLVYILEGVLRFMSDESVEADSVIAALPQFQSELKVDREAFGYDVQFLIQGSDLNVAEIRADIDRLGSSTVVVGSESLVKVHVHTSDPEAPISYGAGLGVLGDVVVENLELQARDFVRERMVVPSRPVFAATAGHYKGTETNVGTLAVVPGDGLAQIFHSLGVSQVLLGGQTMNPSTQGFLDAVGQIEAENVLILPNNGNVILAAQQLERLSEKKVRLIPTKSVPQGIAALLTFNCQNDLETNAQRMFEAAQQVQTIAITRAVRASAVNGLHIKAGDVIGLLDEELVSVGQDEVEVVLDIVTGLDLETYEILTIYYGQASSPQLTEILTQEISKHYPGLEIETHRGGQPYYQYIISLE